MEACTDEYLDLMDNVVGTITSYIDKESLIHFENEIERWKFLTDAGIHVLGNIAIKLGGSNLDLVKKSAFHCVDTFATWINVVIAEMEKKQAQTKRMN